MLRSTLFTSGAERLFTPPPVAAGVYFAKIRTPNRPEATRIVLVR
jgi:hypothetical protein